MLIFFAKIEILPYSNLINFFREILVVRDLNISADKQILSFSSLRTKGNEEVLLWHRAQIFFVFYQHFGAIKNFLLTYINVTVPQLPRVFNVLFVVVAKYFIINNHLFIIFPLVFIAVWLSIISRDENCEIVIKSVLIKHSILRFLLFPRKTEL